MLKRLKNSKAQLPLREAKKTALECYTNLVNSFELNTGHVLNECLSLTPKSGMTKRLTKQENKELQRKQIRRYTDNVEKQLKQSAVKTVLGTRMSKRQFQQVRMAESFEELEEARQRVESNTDSKKSHHPNLKNVEIGEYDESTLISEVNAYPSDKNINWTEISRKYKLRKVTDGSEFGNGGQVLKAYLSSKGVNVDRFQSSSTPIIRRKRKRGPGGEISFPTTATIKEVNETIKQRVNDGIYSVGELIVPKQSSKVTLTQDGQFKTELFQVEGRKIPLHDIRKKLLTKQEEIGILRAKQQAEYDVMPIEHVRSRLAKLNELNKN